MNLLQYELFESISITKNISKTAEQFFISQPAVSNHIKSLEKDLGVELIKRTKHGVTLTDAGINYLPYVRQILELNHKAVALMNSMADGSRGSIRIAVLSSASYMISGCLRDFYEKYPDIHFDITLVGGVEMANLLQQQNHDFYFTVANMPFNRPEFNIVPLEKVPLTIFANKNQVPKMEEIDWEYFSKQPFIMVPSTDISLYGKAMDVCKKHGFEPHVINTYNRAESVVLSIDAGLGVGILPRSFKEIYIRPNLITFEINDPGATSDYVCIWRDKKLNKSAQYFIDLVTSRFQKV